MPHQSPLGTASLGVLCRQGGETSQFAAVGALARSYLGPIVHPANNETAEAARVANSRDFLSSITAGLRALHSWRELWVAARRPGRHLLPARTVWARARLP